MHNRKLLVALVLVTLFIPVAGLAYIWSEIGPTDLETYNFAVFGGGVCYEIICEENGIMVNQDENWTEYTYGGLPVWDVETVMAATADIIVVMGNGTDSDGIYGFNFSNHEFNILHWLLNPRFINYCPADTHYYAGGEDGLFKSEGGLNWQSVPFFDGMYCCDMAVDNDYYVVATSNDVYYSDDAGASWNASTSYLPICDLEVNESGEFYGIFPGISYSSGLWKSNDHGATWTVEIWTMYMTCAGFDEAGNLFVGWNVPQGTPEGFALWWTDISDMQYMNDGLNCLQINQISYNPLIDCVNVIACTDSGVYTLTDYQNNNDPEQITPAEITTHNYPNPFNPDTEISFYLPEAGQMELVIYNTRGQKVRNLFSGYIPAGNNSLSWNGINEQGNLLASGVYHYQITVGDNAVLGKMLMIK